MPGKSKTTTVIPVRLGNEVVDKLRKNHPNVSKYLRDRITYDTMRRHDKRKK